MASALSRRLIKKCKSFSSAELNAAIRVLGVSVPYDTQLLAAAEKEKRRRLKSQKDREELNRKMDPRNFDGDQLT